MRRRLQPRLEAASTADVAAARAASAARHVSARPLVAAERFPTAFAPRAAFVLTRAKDLRRIRCRAALSTARAIVQKPFFAPWGRTKRTAQLGLPGAQALGAKSLEIFFAFSAWTPVSERVASFARVIHMSTESISPEARATTPDVVSRLVASHARFLAFLERRVASRQAAEDILQEAFVRALDRGESLRSDESAQAWFYRLLRNAIIDHYRRKGVERRALDRVAAEPEHDAASSADAELHTTVCDCMSDLIETLKPEYAEALRKVDLAQDGLTSYAKALGITNNNASVRLHRAREALHKQLILSCGTCATHGCLDCHCDRTGKGQCGS